MNRQHHSKAAEPANSTSTGSHNRAHDEATTPIASSSSDGEILKFDECVEAMQPIAPLSRQRVFTHIVAPAHLYATEIIVRVLFSMRTQDQKVHPEEEPFVMFYIVRDEQTKEIVESHLQNTDFQPDASFRITAWYTLAQELEGGQHPTRMIAVLDMDFGSRSELMLSVALLIRIARIQNESLKHLHLVNISTVPTLVWSQSSVEGMVAQSVTLPYQAPSFEYYDFEVEKPSDNGEILLGLASYLAQSAYFESWTGYFSFQQRSRGSRGNVAVVCPFGSIQAFKLEEMLRTPSLFRTELYSYLPSRLEDQPPKCLIITSDSQPSETIEEIRHMIDGDKGLSRPLVLLVDPELRFWPPLPVETIWVVPCWKSETRFNITDLMTVRENIQQTKGELQAMLRFCGANSHSGNIRVVTPRTSASCRHRTS